ncbi:hypothetical protein H9P43_002290 [Blastocladiella emersonii ATCC 22665]|nr:hypothetical protein H9P43_002290 [Blastocladiella emersonii ATCC 22665]
MAKGAKRVLGDKKYPVYKKYIGNRPKLVACLAELGRNYDPRDPKKKEPAAGRHDDWLYHNQEDDTLRVGTKNRHQSTTNNPNLFKVLLNEQVCSCCLVKSCQREGETSAVAVAARAQARETAPPITHTLDSAREANLKIIISTTGLKYDNTKDDQYFIWRRPLNPLTGEPIRNVSVANFEGKYRDHEYKDFLCRFRNKGNCCGTRGHRWRKCSECKATGGHLAFPETFATDKSMQQAAEFVALEAGLDFVSGRFASVYTPSGFKSVSKACIEASRVFNLDESEIQVYFWSYISDEGVYVPSTLYFPTVYEIPNAMKALGASPTESLSVPASVPIASLNHPDLFAKISNANHGKKERIIMQHLKPIFDNVLHSFTTSRDKQLKGCAFRPDSILIGEFFAVQCEIDELQHNQALGNPGKHTPKLEQARLEAIQACLHKPLIVIRINLDWYDDATGTRHEGMFTSTNEPNGFIFNARIKVLKDTLNEALNSKPTKRLQVINLYYNEV